MMKEVSHIPKSLFYRLRSTAAVEPGTSSYQSREGLLDTVASLPQTKLPTLSMAKSIDVGPFVLLVKEWQASKSCR
jgi:hypothetical protein